MYFKRKNVLLKSKQFCKIFVLLTNYFFRHWRNEGSLRIHDLYSGNILTNEQPRKRSEKSHTWQVGNNIRNSQSNRIYTYTSCLWLFYLSRLLMLACFKIALTLVWNNLWKNDVYTYIECVTHGKCTSK